MSSDISPATTSFNTTQQQQPPSIENHYQ
jgi:hypothetical protein